MINEEQLAQMRKRYEMRQAQIQKQIGAINNTFKYMPTLDVKRVINVYDQFDNNFKFNEDETRITKVFGIEIMCDKPECQCFALRLRKDSGFLSLLTTFDFAPMKSNGEDKNLVWVAAFHMKNDVVFPSCFMDSLEDFLNFFLKNAAEDFYGKLDRNRLVIVDDEPEMDEPEYEDNYEDNND